MDKPAIIKKTTIDNTKRLPQSVILLINKQIGRELESSHLYWSMYIWLNYNGYLNSAKTFKVYAEEERSHADKFIDYLLDKDIKPIIPTIAEQSNSEFVDLVDIIKASYSHECRVTDWLNEICCAANETEDYTTLKFLDWFMKEQIEEEAKFKNLLDVWKVLGKTDNKGLALIQLDEMVGEN